MKIKNYVNVHTGTVVTEDELTEEQKEIFEKSKNWKVEWEDVD